MTLHIGKIIRVEVTDSGIVIAHERRGAHTSYERGDNGAVYMRRFDPPTKRHVAGWTSGRHQIAHWALPQGVAEALGFAYEPVPAERYTVGRSSHGWRVRDNLGRDYATRELFPTREDAQGFADRRNAAHTAHVKAQGA